MYLLLRGSRLPWHRRPKLEGKNTVDVYLALLDFLYIMCCKIPMTENTGEDGGNVLRVLSWRGRLTLVGW